MDKYRKLIANTVIFAIGTFSSKMLSLLLVPFYTRVLEGAQYSSGDLLIRTGNLIIPIASVGITNAIIRYGLDKSVKKSGVFTGGLVVVGCGYLLALLGYPLLQMAMISQKINDYTWLVYLFVLTSCGRALCSQFVRARQLVRLYAFDGVLSTFLMVFFNVLFLWVFRMGVMGYVLATILSDLCSAVFLFTIAGLHRFVRFRELDGQLLKSMLRYAIPLIPASLFWWVTNATDHFFVAGLVSPAANGLYVVSYKIPTMITIISSIFADAWQLSAFTESGPGRDKFFTKVFSAYQALIFSAGSGLILLCQPLTRIIADANYFDAWEYIPFLVMATSFSCFVTFLGSIYMVEKKNMLTLVTTAVGAVSNVVLNSLLIPIYGVQGAAFATFVSYFLVFLFRIIDTHRFVKIRVGVPKFVLNMAILLTQCFVMILVRENWLLPQILLCLAVILLNLRQILLNVQKILFRRKRPA